MNNYLTTDNLMPLQLQALIKGQRRAAIIMAIISVASIYFIPWAVFYIILAAKLDPKKVPSHGLIQAAAIVTLPLCLGLIPVIIDIDFWRMTEKLKEYQKLGAEAFISDEQWLANDSKQKKVQRKPLIILASLMLIFAVLILAVVLFG
jgi:hypothetical protein